MDPHINLDGSLFHRSCAKCKDCLCQITLSNFNKHEIGGYTYLLCKTHFFCRFNEVRLWNLWLLMGRNCRLRNCYTQRLYFWNVFFISIRPQNRVVDVTWETKNTTINWVRIKLGKLFRLDCKLPSGGRWRTHPHTETVPWTELR